ncbi:MAG TPA: GNAT family N-acetyltransferase [Candidatus Binataceae bacterium]|nr:GNAT family N-acetyltransferase [Candidatus Binataceae bacterium]
MDKSLPERFETARLTLRRVRDSDVSAIFEYASDPEVTRLMDWRTLVDVSEAAKSVQRSREGWERGTEFGWMITVKPGDFAVGRIACFPNGHRAEIGYLLNRRFWGKGYATEAADCVIKWLLADGGLWRVWATCDVENIASAQVLEKIGMLREGTLRRLAIRPNISEEPRDAFLYAKVRV